MTSHSFAIFDTAIGRCGIVWGARGINWGAAADGQRGQDPYPHSASAMAIIAEAPPSAEVQSAIDGIVELLAGKPNDLTDVVLDLDGVPEFNRGVYDIARTIPPGKTLTYVRDIAKRLGGVELSRDVGQALGRNPCPIVGAPCHRVLAAGGKPGGFLPPMAASSPSSKCSPSKARWSITRRVCSTEQFCLDSASAEVRSLSHKRERVAPRHAACLDSKL